MGSSTAGEPRPELELSANRRPKEVSEVADLYCLRRLTPAQVQVFEEHCLRCLDCAAAVQLTQDLTDGMKGASKQT
jgi:ferredoxin